MPADIGQIVADALGSAQQSVDIGYQDATLTKKTNGTRTSGQLTAGTNPTTATYTCKAIPASRNKKLSDATLTKVGDESILIFRATLDSSVAPEPNDTITLGGSTYVITNTTLDPARAVYICSTRGL